MTQPLKAKLVSMLEVVYPELDCDFLAEELLATMGLGPPRPRRLRTRITGTNRMWC